MKIYVASSWRNEHQQDIVEMLTSLGHEVYDFKNPPHGKGGFHWSAIDPNWENWSAEAYRTALGHYIAEEGFKSDFDAMKWADCCLMVLPCGRSANTEAGWFKGAGKSVYVFYPSREKHEPELMYKMHDGIIIGYIELVDKFTIIEDGPQRNQEIERGSEQTEGAKEAQADTESQQKEENIHKRGLFGTL
jgi:hypothetical protein